MAGSSKGGRASAPGPISKQISFINEAWLAGMPKSVVKAKLKKAYGKLAALAHVDQVYAQRADQMTAAFMRNPGMEARP